MGGRLFFAKPNIIACHSDRITELQVQKIRQAKGNAQQVGSCTFESVPAKESKTVHHLQMPLLQSQLTIAFIHCLYQFQIPIHA